MCIYVGGILLDCRHPRHSVAQWSPNAWVNATVFAMCMFWLLQVITYPCCPPKYLRADGHAHKSCNTADYHNSCAQWLFGTPVGGLLATWCILLGVEQESNARNQSIIRKQFAVPLIKQWKKNLNRYEYVQDWEGYKKRNAMQEKSIAERFQQPGEPTWDQTRVCRSVLVPCTIAELVSFLGIVLFFTFNGMAAQTKSNAVALVSLLSEIILVLLLILGCVFRLISEVIEESIEMEARRQPLLRS